MQLRPWTSVFLLILSVYMTKICKFCLFAGAAALFGFWRFNKSLDTCVDHILAMDGSRLQKELANM